MNLERDDLALASASVRFEISPQLRDDVSATAIRIALAHAMHAQAPAARYWLNCARDDAGPHEILLVEGILAMDRLDWGVFDSNTTVLSSADWLPGLTSMLALMFGHAALVRGGQMRGLQLVESARAADGLDPVVRTALAQTQVHLLLSMGDLEAARAMIAEYGLPCDSRVAIRVLLMTGEYSRADTLLKNTERMTMAPLRERMALRLLAAAAAARLGDGERAGRLIREAIVQAGSIETSLLMLALSDRETLRAAALRDPLLSEAVGRLERALAVEAFSYPRISAGAACLTERERVVLEQLVSEASMRQIAERLMVSLNTLNSQVRSIYRKLGVDSRSAAVSVAVAQGLS